MKLISRLTNGLVVPKIKEEGDTDENQAKNTDYTRVHLKSFAAILIDRCLTQLEDYCSDGLDWREDTERILWCVKLKSEHLLCVRVDGAIHESPRESECVDQDAILILANHEEAEEPDYNHVDDICDNAGPVADPINNLTHY